MSPLSEVLLRSRDRLLPGLLLVNWPADGLAASLAADGLEPQLFTQDQAVARQQPAAEFGLHCAGGNYPQIALALPREAARRDFLLAMSAAALAPGGELLVVGEKRGGIKSSRKRIEAQLGPITHADAARHCALYAVTPARPAAFRLDDWFSDWQLPGPAGPIALHSLPGLFCAGRLDAGTALLLEHLPVPERGPVLDVGSGAGVIGLWLAAQAPGLNIDLVDSSALAVAATTRAIAGRAQLRSFASDIYSAVDGRYQMIVSNPPFHDGVATEYAPAARLIAEAPARLHRGGELWLVANRFLDYPRQLAAVFKRVDTIADNGRFRVLRAQAP